MEQINEAVEKRAGGTRLKKKGGIGGPLLTALALTAAVGGGAYLGLCAYAVNSDAIWRNTYVLNQDIGRSEERRVGKEGRSRWSPDP